MPKHSVLNCPHCGKQSKLIPLSGPGPPSPTGATFESIAPTFDTHEPSEHITTTRAIASFWASDAINHALTGLAAGSVILLYSWWYELDYGLIVSGVTVATIIGLPILKLWLHRPRSASVEQTPQDTTIKIEHISDDKRHYLFAELNPSIRQHELHKLAQTVVAADMSFTMTISQAAGFSQAKHHKIKEDFLRIGYIQPLPNGANGYTVTGQGRRFFRQAAMLP